MNNDPAPSAQPPQPVANSNNKPRRKWLTVLVLLLIILAIGGYFGLIHKSKTKTTEATKTSDVKQAGVPGLQLDPNKKYGNKYADGLLPVGDGKYVTDAPKTGYIYACSQYAQNLKTDQGGAGTRGPWFTDNNTQYDINKKVHVSGSVSWQSNFSNTLNGNQRLITTNGLPNHVTGIFPIQSSDAAYAYDRNPNKISAQSLTYTLAADPVYGSPNCMGGESGVMLSGVPIFNGFDAGGRDAGAWEVQDSCSGHPQVSGEYHYHTLSSCITDADVDTVIGFALDGFPITGPRLAKDNILTTGDLDECHGIVSQINLDNKKVTTYHYVMTQDFPYSVSCFRATPIQPPHSAQNQTTPKQPPTGPPPR